MDKNQQQGMTKQTTQLSTQQSALACTGQPEWINLATEKEIDAKLSEIQWAKGKFYSQVIAKMTEKMPKEEFEKRTMEHRKGMIYVIKGLKVSREELGVITREQNKRSSQEQHSCRYQPNPTW